MIMPTLMVLLLWLVAGLCRLVWWQVADRVWDALRVVAERRHTARKVRNVPLPAQEDRVRG